MTEPSQYFKGRTVQEQMNEVIGYVDVRAEEVAAAKADDVLEPAEQAKDDAIAAKEAAEQARDTTLAALPQIQQDITDLKAEDVALDGRLDTVELKVQTVEGNIVTIQGQIVALQTADGQNVKLNTVQTIPAAKVFGGQITATGQRAYSPGNTTDVATIGTLDAYTPMVRTTGLQNILGDKHFLSTIFVEKTTGSFIWSKALNLDVNEARDNYQYFQNIIWGDKNGVECIRLFPRITQSGRIDLVADVRKPDGTWSFQNVILQGPE